MVLLPLHGWTGAAMATDMAVSAAAQQMHQTASAAHQTQAEVTTSTADCLIHADCGQTHHADHSAGDCESCSTCQACHNVPLLVDSDDLKPSLNSLWASTEALDPFASTDAAPDQKPPIA